MCDKNCCLVGKLLYCSEIDDIEEANDEYSDELLKCMSYQEIMEDDYGHINYALAAYCVIKGHNQCLKHLHRNSNFMWHADLATVASENNNIECLKYILEYMGDVHVPTIESETSDKIKNYLEQYNNVKYIKLKKITK